MKRKKFRISRKLKNTFLIIIATIILTGVLRNVYFKPEYVIKPAPYTEKYTTLYQYIHDGDTAVFFLENGEKVICRFLAVDTPEIEEEGYEEAKRYTDRILSNARQIIIELDPFSEKYDKYDRLLAWVWVDGELLQAKLLENNYATLRYLYHDYLYLDYLESIKPSVTSE